MRLPVRKWSVSVAVTKVTFDDHGHMKRARDVIFGMDMHINPISILV